VGGEEFVDGATGANNPIQELWTEAFDTYSESFSWKLEDNIQCLVSIGTGKLLLTAFGTDLLQNEVGKALVAIATNTDQIADTFQKHHSKLYQDGIAFRFNVGQGLETIGLEEATKMDDIQAATRRYIATEDGYTSLSSCSKRLKRRACMLDFS
jgi:hypothetical protein